MFRDRVDAGRQLGEALSGLAVTEAVVLGIPRGGVIVAAEVARSLGAGLDVVVPRKIGAKGNPELAIGAIAPGLQVWDARLLERLGVTQEYLQRAVSRAEDEIERRTATYREGRAPVAIEGRTAILVDDGIATGATAIAAARWARAAGAAAVLVAAPVASPEAISRLRQDADAVKVLEAPPDFRAVGEWYRDFAQTSDDEVVTALRAMREDP